VRRLISSLRVFPCHIADPLVVAQLNDFAPDVIYRHGATDQSMCFEGRANSARPSNMIYRWH